MLQKLRFERSRIREVENPCPCKGCDKAEDCSDWLLACQDYKKYFDTGVSENSNRNPNHRIFSLVFGNGDLEHFLEVTYPILLKLLTRRSNVIKFLSNKWQISEATTKRILRENLTL